MDLLPILSNHYCLKFTEEVVAVPFFLDLFSSFFRQLEEFFTLCFLSRDCMHGTPPHVTNFCDCLSSVMNHFPPMPDPAGAAPKPQVGTLPSEFNWRDHEGGDWTTSAKHQSIPKLCGSCWDFAALGALEAVINIAYGNPDLDLDLSEQYVLSCLPAAGDCDGGSSNLAFRYIKSEEAEGNYVNGIIPESCFPYQTDDTVPCSDKCPNWENQLIPISDYGYWYPNLPSDRGAIKSQLMEKGPIVAYMPATDDFKTWGWSHHDSDDYYPDPGPVGDINHVVVIVGWKMDPNFSPSHTSAHLLLHWNQEIQFDVT